MPKMTIQQRLIRFLASRGCEQVPCGSRKYIQMTTGTEFPYKFYFLGRSGAVRTGRCSTKSISVTDVVQANMRKWEKENGL